MKLGKTGKKIAFVAGLLLQTGLIEVYVGATLIRQYTVQSNVTVENPLTLRAGIYRDLGCSVALTSIDWGTLTPGQTASQIGYLRNEGDLPFNLTLSTQNWSPTDGNNYIKLAWNYTAGTPIKSGEVKVLKFTLQVTTSAPKGTTQFSFDIVITATEV